MKAFPVGAAIWFSTIGLLPGQVAPASEARISLVGRAHVHRPVWIEVKLPDRFQGSVRYPITIYPSDFGGHRFEVRRNGIVLPRADDRQTYPRAGGGLRGYGAIGGGALLGLPHEPKNTGRLPLHLAFRFDEPGRYDVRYTGYVFGRSMAQQIRSAWLTIEVHPDTPVQRLAWLEGLSKSAPSDTVELLSDYLPSLLAWPDAAALNALEDFLYHPNDLVRKYILYSLYAFDDDLLVKWVIDAIGRRGPTEDLAYLLSWRRDLFQTHGPELFNSVSAHLRSQSALLTGGALRTLGFMRAHYDWKSDPLIPANMDTAVMNAAEALIGRGSQDILQPLALYLGGMKTDRSRGLLWRLVDEGVVREQALICLTWIGDRRDLPRLAAYGPNLDYHLNRAYGAAAAAYLNKRRNPR